jgi:hypothetical protein
VIGVSLERGLLPASVGRLRARAAKASERALVAVADRVVRKRGGERVALELGVSPRARDGADVDQFLDAGGSQYGEQLVERSGRVPDRVDGAGVSYAAGV